MTEREDDVLAEQFEEALDVWSEYDWNDGEQEWILQNSPSPVCDLENPEVCESCQ